MTPTWSPPALLGPVRSSSLAGIVDDLAATDWSLVDRVIVAAGYANEAGVLELVGRIPASLALTFVSGGGPLQTSTQAARALLSR